MPPLPLQKRLISRNCREAAKKTKEGKKRGHAVSRRGKSWIYRNTFQASRPASCRRSMRATITTGLPLLNCNGSVYYLLQGQTRFRYSRQQLERGPSSSTRTRPWLHSTGRPCVCRTCGFFRIRANRVFLTYTAFPPVSTPKATLSFKPARWAYVTAASR